MAAVILIRYIYHRCGNPDQIHLTWLRCLKPFEPVVLSLSGQDYIFKKVAMITEDTGFLNNTIYIGKLSEAVYRILSVNGVTMFLINDLSLILDKLNAAFFKNAAAVAL